DGPQSTITWPGARVNEKLAAAGRRQPGRRARAIEDNRRWISPCKRLAERLGFLNERETSDREPGRCLHPADRPQPSVRSVRRDFSTSISCAVLVAVVPRGGPRIRAGAQRLRGRE